MIESNNSIFYFRSCRLCSLGSLQLSVALLFGTEKRGSFRTIDTIVSAEYLYSVGSRICSLFEYYTGLPLLLYIEGWAGASVWNVG